MEENLEIAALEARIEDLERENAELRDHILVLEDDLQTAHQQLTDETEELLDTINEVREAIRGW